MPRIHVAIPFKFTHPVDGQVDYAAGIHKVDDFTAEHPFTKAHLANAPPPPPVPGSTAFSVAENARKARAAAVQAMSDDELAEALKDRPFVRQEPVVPGKFAEHASLAPVRVPELEPEAVVEEHHKTAEMTATHAEDHESEDDGDEDGEDDGEDGEEHEDEAKPAGEGGEQQPRVKRRRRRRKG